MSAAHDLAAHAHHQEDRQFNRSGEKRTLIVVVLATIMMVGEIAVGTMTGSVALKTDGWHMGTHVGALGMTLFAYWYARRHAGNDAFSFGTGKVYSLAGFASGIVLTIVAIMVAKEGIEHLIDQEVPDYQDALPVAAIALAVNLVSAIILAGGHHFGHAHGGHDHGHGHGHGHDHHDHDHDHGHEHDHHGHDHAKPEHEHPPRAPRGGTLDFNMRAAYIHIIADALTSVLAIAALSLGWKFDLWYLDALMGVVGATVIISWALSLCRQAARQLLDVVSSPTHEDVVRKQLEAIDDVRVADLHVWELGPGRRSCIVSIVTAAPRDVEFYRTKVLDALAIAHLTIEIHRCELAHSEPQVAHAHEH